MESIDLFTSSTDLVCSIFSPTEGLRLKLKEFRSKQIFIWKTWPITQTAEWIGCSRPLLY